LPLSAKVYAVVIELRTATVGTYSFEQCNSFRYRPEYFNADLLSLEHRMLSEPFEVTRSALSLIARLCCSSKPPILACAA
jgi:hypothetical protein